MGISQLDRVYGINDLAERYPIHTVINLKKVLNDGYTKLDPSYAERLTV